MPEEEAYHFIIYSKHATHVTLLVYDGHYSLIKIRKNRRKLLTEFIPSSMSQKMAFNMKIRVLEKFLIFHPRSEWLPAFHPCYNSKTPLPKNNGRFNE